MDTTNMDPSKSKLPTMIRRPAVVIRSQTNDRPTHSQPVSNVISKSTASNARAQLLANRPPLSQNIENILMNNGNSNHSRPLKRCASPEFRGTKSSVTMSNLINGIKRPKLRRSRSVNDMTTMKPISKSALTQGTQKRVANGFAMPNLPPAKNIRPNAITKPSAAVTRFTKQTTLATANKKPLTTAKTDTATAKVPPPKKIPPYDYKARFLDLSEKHKALKEKHDQLKEKLVEYESLPEQYEECQNNLHRTENELKNVRIQMECLERQTNADKLKIDSLNNQLVVKTDECRTVTENLAAKTEEFRVVTKDINEQNAKLTNENVELKDCKVALTKSNEELLAELEEARELLFKSSVERKELHNMVMDLRGNIRVFCRVRPPLVKESTRSLCTWAYPDQTMVEISNVDHSKKTVKHEFSFDQVFAPCAPQDEIFELVSPLIQSALDGYNVCIFAYGQTGSGKTYTMDGVDTHPGIIPRTVDLLFDCFDNYKKLGWTFRLTASFLEIYNEYLLDLLSNEDKELEIRLANKTSKTEIYVQHLTEIEVDNKATLYELMELAKINRATEATAGNERSSRSHAVTQLKLFGTHKEKNESSAGMINLIDLAGSESPKTSVRMEETKKINKSLSELTNVIMALLQKQDHVPYRNSKLTHLLMPSLGGNSKTLMFVNVSPFQDCFIETVKSLRFAASVNSCKMNKAKKNKYYTQPGALAPPGMPSSSSCTSLTNLSSASA